MLDLQQINERSHQAAEKAAREGLKPFVVWPGDKEKMPPFPFPFIGSYDPPGWAKTDEYFVDSSSFGADDEPAMSVRQFKEVIKEGKGYAIIEAGEFQVYVGEFVRVNEEGRPVRQ